MLGQGDERELGRRFTERAPLRLAAPSDRGIARSKADQRDRELLDPVRSDEVRHLGIGEARPEPWSEARRLREHHRLGQHRARVPVDVAETALGVPPGRLPGRAGHDQGRRVATRRRPDLDERMPDRVVPVHAVREVLDTVGRHVEFEREATTGRAGRAEQPRARVRRSRRTNPDDTGRQMEQPRETSQIDRRRRGVVSAGEDRRGRHIDRGPDTRQLDRRQSGRVHLAGRRQSFERIRDEVLDHQRVLDRRQHVRWRHIRVRGQAVVQPSGGTGGRSFRRHASNGRQM